MLGTKDGLHKSTEALRVIPVDGVHVAIDID